MYPTRRRDAMNIIQVEQFPDQESCLAHLEASWGGEPKFTCGSAMAPRDSLPAPLPRLQDLVQRQVGTIFHHAHLPLRYLRSRSC